MTPLSHQIVQKVEGLPEADQRQILDFVDFLVAKRRQSRERSLREEPKSFAETARASLGAGRGPGDLLSNPAYMEGYGQ